MGTSGTQEGTYQPSPNSSWLREGRAVAPEYRVIGHEVGQNGGQEKDTQEHAEDVEN